MFFNVNDKEAQKLLDKLIQGGLVSSYPLDGIHFQVKH